MRKFVLLLCSALIAVCTGASATDEYNHSIVSVGAHGLGYVQFKEALSQPCQVGVVYLPDLGQYNARAMMAVLLSAQARGARYPDSKIESNQDT